MLLKGELDALKAGNLSPERTLRQVRKDSEALRNRA